MPVVQIIVNISNIVLLPLSIYIQHRLRKTWELHPLLYSHQDEGNYHSENLPSYCDNCFSFF